MQAITDSHVHFWNPNKLRYCWLDDLPELNRSYLPEHFPSGNENWQINRIVFVQADCSPEQGIEEADWVADLAASDVRIQGIVAFAPLESPAVSVVLEHLKAKPLVKGVRRLIQSESSGFAAQPAFVAGVQLLPHFNLSFDLCARFHQLPDVIELVRRCPETQFVLDHIGKPDIKKGELKPWGDYIQTLASFPNVWCKLSGLVTEADHERWTPDDLRPFVTHVISAFTINRVMYGGDWPVVRLATPYENWIETLNRIVSDLSETEKELLFQNNADRFYRL